MRTDRFPRQLSLSDIWYNATRRLRRRPSPFSIVASVLIVGLVGASVVSAVRADEPPSTEAAASQSLSWFANSGGELVLVDGQAGRATARLDPTSGQQPTNDWKVIDGPAGAYVTSLTTTTARRIDSATVQLGPPVEVDLLSDPSASQTVTTDGLMVISSASRQGVIVRRSGETNAFDVDAAERIAVGSSGSVWGVFGGDLHRLDAEDDPIEMNIDGDVLLTTVGDEALVIAPSSGRAWFASSGWVDLPTDATSTSWVVQEPGPSAPCGWVGNGNSLWCVGPDGVDATYQMEGSLSATSRLAVGGDAGAIIDADSFTAFNARTGQALGDRVELPPSNDIQIRSTQHLIWVDVADGDRVWSVSPWAVSEATKMDERVPLFGSSGRLMATGESDTNDAERAEYVAPSERLPDNNGVDDPPVAQPDEVTARFGMTLSIRVTANDFDPDGEAVGVSSVSDPVMADGNPGSAGSTAVADANTVSFYPSAGFSGIATFTYTIVDGNGTESTAPVTINMLAAGDQSNTSPVANDDSARTRVGNPVVIDVLNNDIDPEGDPIWIETIGEPTVAGSIVQVLDASGRPAIRFHPEGSGEATISYRVVDQFGAVSNSATAVVSVHGLDVANEPPRVAPDSVRLRRDTRTLVPVLANDIDPDADTLGVRVVRPLPRGLTVQATYGGNLAVTVGREVNGSALSFQYLVEDGNGGEVLGDVLAIVTDDNLPNEPPTTNPDRAVVVAGQQIRVDALANDTDPDGDRLRIVDAGLVGVTTSDGTARADIEVTSSREAINVSTARTGASGPAVAQLMYTVSDGNDHLVSNVITLQVLPSLPSQDPYAQDDVITTVINTPIAIDVLRNDGDGGGGALSLVDTPTCIDGGSVEIDPDQRIVFTPPAEQVGRFTCGYEVVNGEERSASANLVVTVELGSVENSPPVAEDDAVTVEPSASFAIDVLANDYDPNGGDTIALETVDQPDLGSASVSDGKVDFTAPATEGETTFSYRIRDSQGATAVGSVSIEIRARAESVPIATPDIRQLRAPYDTEVAIDVLANDDANGGGNLRIVSVTEGRHDGTYVFLDPSGMTDGTITAQYTVENEAQQQASTTVSLRIIPQAQDNTPPSFQSTTVRATVGDSGALDLTRVANDAQDGFPNVTLIGTSGTSAVASVSGTTFNYHGNAPGTTTATLRVTDSGGESITGSITIEVVAADVSGNTCPAPIARTLDPGIATGPGARLPLPSPQQLGANGTVTWTNLSNQNATTFVVPSSAKDGDRYELTFTVTSPCGSGTVAGTYEVIIAMSDGKKI